MAEFIFDPKHLWIIIGAMILSLLLMGAGRGGGKLLVNLLRRFLDGEKSHNLGGVMTRKECEQCGLMNIDPSKCPLHQSEHERSIRNESGIKELGLELKETLKVLFGKLDGMEVTITEIKVAVAKLVVERNYQMDQRERKR